MKLEVKSLFQMAAAMCQALPSFYSEFCQKSLFIPVSSDFYENYIVTNNVSLPTILTVVWKIVSFTYF